MTYHYVEIRDYKDYLLETSRDYQGLHRFTWGYITRRFVRLQECRCSLFFSWRAIHKELRCLSGAHANRVAGVRVATWPSKYLKVESLIVRETQMRPSCDPVEITSHPSSLPSTRVRTMTSGAPGLDSAHMRAAILWPAITWPIGAIVCRLRFSNN